MKAESEALRAFWLHVKSLETELRAYEYALRLLEEHPESADFAALLKSLVEQQRSSFHLAEEMRRLYDVPLDEFLRQNTGGSLQLKEALRLFEMLQPPDKKHLQ